MMGRGETSKAARRFARFGPPDERSEGAHPDLPQVKRAACDRVRALQEIAGASKKRPWPCHLEEPRPFRPKVGVARSSVSFRSIVRGRRGRHLRLA